MKSINYIYRGFRSIILKIWNSISNFISYLLLKVNLVKLGYGFKSKGIPKLILHKNGKFIIGNYFKLNNTIAGNPIGRSYECLFRVGEDALLRIGDNVGISGTVIVCHHEIIISDNVKIGGNTCIYDTDFHSLNANDRIEKELDIKNTKKKKVFIGENVFIGAHVTVLKGVNIGKNSIIGACSVVTKDVPSNQIWAGNPAKFIREIR